MRLAAVILAVSIGIAPAWAADRALVIGNADYRHAPDLAGSDTAGLARALREAGFTTQGGVDLDSAALARAIAALTRAGDGSGVRVVVLSGRFLHDADETWFMGSDAGRPGPATVAGQGLPLSRVLRLMAAAPPGAVLVLGTDGQQMPHQPGLQNGIGALSGMAPAVSVITGSPEAGARAVTALARGVPLRQAVAAEPGLRLLGADAPRPASTVMPEPELRAADRAALQSQLARLGHDPGAADGVFGARSRKAIAGWQQANGLAATGHLTLGQMRQIDRQSRRAETADPQPGPQDRGRDSRPGGLAASLGLAVIAAGPGDPGALRDDAATWRWSRRQDSAAAYDTYLERFPAGRHAAEAEERLRTLRVAIEVAQAEEGALDLDQTRRHQIEQQLQLAGMQPGPVDGDFTSETRAALRRYQAARNLRVTGHVTQQTMASLIATDAGR